MPILAQTFPGMQWIPVMLFVTCVGLVLGTLSLLLRPFRGARTLGHRLGTIALVTGIVSPCFFFAVLLGTSGLVPLGYMILATPAVPGAVAFMIYPPPERAARGFPVGESNSGAG